MHVWPEQIPLMGWKCGELTDQQLQMGPDVATFVAVTLSSHVTTERGQTAKRDDVAALLA